MKVNVSFTLDVDPVEWLGRPYFGQMRKPAEAASVETIDETVVQSEVRFHAESVIRDLYTDQGWLIEGTQAESVGNDRFTAAQRRASAALQAAFPTLLDDFTPAFFDKLAQVVLETTA